MIEKKEAIYALPILHYNVETAAEVYRAVEAYQPDCIAVELPEPLQGYCLSAAGRLPDISIVVCRSEKYSPLYYLATPDDAAFEGLRSALDRDIPAFCIDLAVENYSVSRERMPDPYAIATIGLERYWRAYRQHGGAEKSALDCERELYMARRLKELTFSFERILFVVGMSHVDAIIKYIDQNAFPEQSHCRYTSIEVMSPTEASLREILPEGGYLTAAYEQKRGHFLDRWDVIFGLYRRAAERYSEKEGRQPTHFELKVAMRFLRNYAIVTERLSPTLFQLITGARSCIDHNYAYEVWKEATSYPFLKNIDNLPEITLSPEELWGKSQKIAFELKERQKKGMGFSNRFEKEKTPHRFSLLPGHIGFCSYQPEDIAIETFSTFLQKKGTQILADESRRIIPFSASMEEGIDMRETLRHWYEKKIYVKTPGRPPGKVGSVVVIFDPDNAEEEKSEAIEKYPWKATWHGEHHQESDMAFYATPFGHKLVGPGICRCEYGGFMLTYPPRRVYDVWTDPDYAWSLVKSETLLLAAIDYALSPTIVYVAAAPPRTLLKNYARRYGKKVVYIPVGQLSPQILGKLRSFHVLDHYARRAIADDYIF